MAADGDIAASVCGREVCVWRVYAGELLSLAQAQLACGKRQHQSVGMHTCILCMLVNAHAGQMHCVHYK